MVGASRAGVMLLDGESRELEPKMIRPDHPIAPDDLAEMTRVCHAVIASGEPLYAPVDAALGHIEPGALLPLRVRGQALGGAGDYRPAGQRVQRGTPGSFRINCRPTSQKVRAKVGRICYPTL